MNRFEGVRRREVAKMAKTIKELDITAKGQAITLMMAVTRFMVKRSETLSKAGSGKWKHGATNSRSCMEVLPAAIASSAVQCGTWNLQQWVLRQNKSFNETFPSDLKVVCLETSAI